MARTLNPAAKRALTRLANHLDGQDLQLAEMLLADAQAEDVAALDEALLERAVRETAATLKAHKRGTAQVHTAQAEFGARPATIFAIVNDNMPFLFDSVLGAMNERTPSVEFVVHPIIDVQLADGASQIIDTAKPGKGALKSDQKSVICVIVSGLDEAGEQSLVAEIRAVLDQVHAVVRDWRQMVGRMDELVGELSDAVLPARKSDVVEALAFLRWLKQDNFTFLGIRDYDFVGGEKSGRLQRADLPAFGILGDSGMRVLRRGGDPVTTTPEIRAFLNSRDVLIVTKANLRSVVHRRVYMDYVGIKRYDEKGKLCGETRIVGLFTSTAYTQSVQRIPYLRSKIDAVVKRSHRDPNSYSGKALFNVLESYPRDELFQIDAPMLTRNAEAIIALADRPRVRVLARIDSFDRFVSVIVFVPRDHYDSDVREQIGAYLADVYEGHVSAWYPAFPEGGLARVHIIIGRHRGETPKPTQASLERGVREIVRTWEDGLADAINAAGLDVASARYAFPQSYKDTVPPELAVDDLQIIDQITYDDVLAADLSRNQDDPDHLANLRVYHADEPVALSERVPVLENMGFRVISELTYRVGCGVSGEDRPHCIWLHDMRLESANGANIDLTDDGVRFEEAFHAAWSGRTANDGFNGLILAAGMDERTANVLRAYGRYLIQAPIGFSQDYLAATLVRYPDLARLMFDLFEARFNPERRADADEDCAVTEKHLLASFNDYLAEVPSFDEDRILRAFRTLICATLRTNFYHRDPKTGAWPQTLAFKLDSEAIAFLPHPHPHREIFVFGAGVEGVHLRFGPIARGGLRWSDRAEDYRTEVLGLVKAQQVKNAVIVPVGAKGGFLPKRLPVGGSRDDIYEAGRAAYITFVSALLSVTDNLKDDAVVPPQATVRHDQDDAYLVVAADKGTAAFSDTANSIAREHGFWLDDAFASGGSAGYDHKKMAITARGAWEAVKRHFREMDKDIQTEPFTVAGVGDMSGDVFGNGMLLSEQIRLVAAFDHRDIFIDPDPDPATGFAERKRLFALGRSSWQDYDKGVLSKGGGIFPRNQKMISLSRAAADAIGLDKQKASPFEIMTAILKADVELMWFGGIGTYIRSASESNSDVGDRTNDAIRITASEVRARVIGEGANLGVTQRARIEYGLAGGRCNSDAIDNSAGVNTSDVEVNIKIALAAAMAAGTLTRQRRDKLLAAMTDSVAHLVLRNNYEQTLTISRTHRKHTANLPLQERLMESLEQRGALDRSVEMLPDDDVLANRRQAGQGLSRAEIGVLVSYAKIALLDDLIGSELPDDPYLERTLIDYFPPRMHEDFAGQIKTHPLRREIIATALANDVINRGGPSLIVRFEDVTGMMPSAIANAHVVVRDAYGLEELHAAIDGLDTRVSGEKQLEFYSDLADSYRESIGHMLRSGRQDATLADAVEKLGAARRQIEAILHDIVPHYIAEWMTGRKQTFIEAGLAPTAAARLAMLPIVAMTPDIVAASVNTGRDTIETATAYFHMTKSFRIGRLEHLARQLQGQDYFDRLAQQRALGTINAARLLITTAALQGANGAGPVDAIDAWIAAKQPRIGRVQERIFELTDHGDLTVSRLTVAAGLLGDLVA